MNFSRIVVSLTLLSLSCLASSVSAQTPAFSVATAAGQGLTNPGGTNLTLGYSFTVGSSAISASSLGYYDLGGNGLTNSHVVSIWDSVGTQVATATVPSGTTGTLIGEYRYISLATPVALAAGGTYTIGATGNVDDQSRNFIAASSVTATTGVTLGAALGRIGSNARPTSDAFAQGHYMTPNFQFAAIPEPATLVFLVLGGSLTILKRRRH